MQELSVEEVAEVNGGFKLVKVLYKAFELGYAVGQGINWIHDRTYMGRGEFPSVPRAGHE